MMHRDRAWRRKMTRLSTLHSDEVISHLTTSSQAPSTDKPHQHGKLTHTQAMRLDGQLNTDLREAWTPEYTLPMEQPPNLEAGNL